MSSNSQAAENKDAKKKKNKGSLAVGLLSQAGTAAKKAWEDGTLVRTPKELLTQYNPLDKTESYSYSALPTPSSIRLLEVGAGNPSDLIQCKLHIVDLRDSPRYIALSYSWEKDGSWTKFAAEVAGGLLGDALQHAGINLSKSKDSESDSESTSTRVMLCDGKKMIIKPNLYDALLQLRQVAPGYYWIDAVCMNQGDNDEKTQQIRMMSDIYHASESVIVWLGKCPQLLSRGVARFEAAQGLLGPMKQEDEKMGKKQMLGDDSESYTFIGAAYLVSRRWFGRLWVLQEFCLARRIDIQFGEHRIRPETVVGLIQSLKDYLEGKDGDGKGKSEYGFTNVFRPFWGQHLKFVPSLFESRQQFQQGIKWSVEEWLHLTRGRSASDNRDFVNAGLALIRQESLTIDQSLQLEDAFPLSQTGPRLWPCLRATAGVDKFEVLLNLTACLLTQNQSVFVLSLGALGDDPTLPTWVPEPGSVNGRVVEPLAFQKGTNFGACVTLVVDSPLESDPVTGLIDYLNTEISKFRRKLNKLSKPRPQQSSIDSYVSRKMAARREEPNEEEAKKLAMSLDEAWAKLKSIYPNKPWPSSDAKPGQELTTEHKNFMQVAVKINAWRTLFLTQEGLLGLGGCWIEEGEVVMLVDSGYVPYIFDSAEKNAKKNAKEIEEKLEKLTNEPQPLATKKKKNHAQLKARLDQLQSRMGKQGGAWALHGEAYVHGVMHGEALDGSRIFEPIAVN
ncbi:heterokaryon incompatibility protein-domain-containing protein [Xylaria arbuscula]|nr:heterokaryon incompatibility protein-domain-containing protein [Xylaria arbuscula]